jgi:hypothetical protein
MAMDHLGSTGATLSREELHTLLALVDGTLAPEEHRAAMQRVAASAQLRQALAEQARVASLLRSAHPTAPPAVRRRVDELHHERPRFQPGSSVTLAGALAAVLAALVLAVAGRTVGPGVSDAVALGRLRPDQPAPRVLAPDRALLDREVAGVRFPNWHAELGWKASGMRTDELKGREAVTVFYDHMGHRVAYTVLTGDALAPPRRAHRVRLRGIELTAFRDGTRHVVTFRRHGHTCVLSGDVTHAGTLLRLASWRAHGAVGF